MEQKFMKENKTEPRIRFQKADISSAGFLSEHSDATKN